MSSMGTYAIFRQMRQHWAAMSHPIYLADLRQRAPNLLIFTALNGNQPWPGWKTRIFMVLLGITLLILLPGFLSAFFGTILPLMGVWLAGVTWVGYTQITMRTSQIIVQERVKHTWDPLLMLPIEWDSLILAKLAAAFRTISIDLFLWLQVVFVTGIYAYLIYAEINGLSAVSPQNVIVIVVSYLPLFVLTLITFTIGRLQDYILVSLIGFGISLYAPSIQVAPVAGLFAALSYLLIWLLMMLPILPSLAIGPFSSAGILLLAFAGSGPTGSIVLALPLPLAIIAVGVFIGFRELMISALFDWLTRHLSER